MENVVVSGIGCVSAMGIGREEFAAKLMAGESGVGDLKPFEGELQDCRQAARVPEIDFKQLLPGVDLRSTDRATCFALLAAKLAIEDAGMDLEKEDRRRIAVVLGTAETSFTPSTRFYQDFVEHGPFQLNPIVFANTPINVPTARVSMYFRLHGPNTTISNGQTSSLKALAYGADLIRLGQADIVLAGGVEALSEEKFVAYHRLRTLTGQKRGAEAKCAPFDVGRNGLVLGEGAAVLVLQSEARARATQTPRRVALSGSGGGLAPGVRPDGQALAIAIRNALDEARIDARALDLVLANANGSIANDRGEAKALRTVFGLDYPELGVASIKAATGELRGAAGVMQAVAGVIAIEAGRIPPTLNLRAPDRALPPCTISSQSVPREIHNVLINASERAADSYSLIVSRCEGE